MALDMHFESIKWDISSSLGNSRYQKLCPFLLACIWICLAFSPWSSIVLTIFLFPISLTGIDWTCSNKNEWVRAFSTIVLVDFGLCVAFTNWQAAPISLARLGLGTLEVRMNLACCRHRDTKLQQSDQECLLKDRTVNIVENLIIAFTPDFFALAQFATTPSRQLKTNFTASIVSTGAYPRAMQHLHGSWINLQRSLFEFGQLWYDQQCLCTPTGHWVAIKPLMLMIK